MYRISVSEISLLILTTILIFPAEQASKLHCPHKELDEALKSLLGNLSKQVSLIQEYLLFDYKNILHQVSERQASELSHATFLQLNINTNDGVETLNIGENRVGFDFVTIQNRILKFLIFNLNQCV